MDLCAAWEAGGKPAHACESSDLHHHAGFIRPCRHLVQQWELGFTPLVRSSPIFLIGRLEHVEDDGRCGRGDLLKVRVLAIDHLSGFCQSVQSFLRGTGARELP